MEEGKEGEKTIRTARKVEGGQRGIDVTAKEGITREMIKDGIKGIMEINFTRTRPVRLIAIGMKHRPIGMSESERESDMREKRGESVRVLNQRIVYPTPI